MRSKRNDGNAGTFTKHNLFLFTKYQYLELKHGMRRICSLDVVVVGT